MDNAAFYPEWRSRLAGAWRLENCSHQILKVIESCQTWQPMGLLLG
ncbi:hypothetical protein H6F77_23910 [Microcoleus sp. FACHB-831]|nr:hypothetical protein [Microcoleus sp. FACHB-831]MBD1924091.1 hypothetical protein [Microcoleus sp. FACHB-831]